MAEVRVTDLQALANPEDADVLLAVDVSADRDSKLTLGALQAAIGDAFAPAVHQHSTGEITNFNASSRAQTEAALVAGANITLTPSGAGATRTITVAASGGGGGGGGTVTQVDGGAGLTGSVTTSGSLAVGQGAGITVNANDVAINRATVDTWYASAAQGALAATALQPGSVDLGFNASTRTITNTGGDSAVLPLVTSGAAGLAPQSGGGTSNFLRADGTWAAPPAGGGGATNLDGLSDVTLTAPATDQVLKFNGTQWVNAAAPGGGGGTVTQVTGGAGLTGSVTTTGSLAVGQGTGITVNADDVAINRATVDGWYLPRANHTGTQAVSTIQVANAARLIGAPAASGPAQEIQVFGPLFFNAGALQVAPASGSVEGSMSSANFTKLAGIAPNATANPVAVDSNITGVTGADRITNMISLTQAEYDAIGTKNASTLYVISG